MPATPRIRMVYKNKGLVKRGCCVVESGGPSCITPTMSISVVNNGSFFVCTVTITGSPPTGLQWKYITGVGPVKDSTPFIDDPPNVSGSTTTQLTLDAAEYAGFTIVCSGPDPCAEGGGIVPQIRSNEITLP
jgi:hypothetical protein